MSLAGPVLPPAKARTRRAGVLSSLIVTACIIGGALVLQGACVNSIFNDCTGKEPPRCVSETRRLECVGGEGAHRLQEIDCPPEERCLARSTGDLCVRAGENAACQTDRGCEPRLRCESGVCRGPLPEELARCQAATEIVVPDDGSTVVADIPLQTPSGIVTTIRRDICASSGAERVVAEGFGRLVVTGNDAFVEVAFVTGVEAFPEGIQVGPVSCDALYVGGASLPCQLILKDDAPRVSFVQCQQELIFYTSRTASAPSIARITVRKTRDFGSRSTSCRKDGGSP